MLIGVFNVIYEKCIREASLGSEACIGLAGWARLGLLSRAHHAARVAVDAQRRANNTGYPVERRIRQLLEAKHVAQAKIEAIIESLRASPRLVCAGSAMIQAVTEGVIYDTGDFDIFTDNYEVSDDDERFVSILKNIRVVLPLNIYTIYANAHLRFRDGGGYMAKERDASSSYAQASPLLQLNMTSLSELNGNDIASVLSARFDLPFCAVFAWIDVYGCWQVALGHPRETVMREAVLPILASGGRELDRVMKYVRRGFTITLSKKRERDDVRSRCL
jgi:hypothetical protein